MEADTSDIEVVREEDLAEQAGDDEAPLAIERATAHRLELDAVWVGAAEGPRALDRSNQPAIAELFERARQEMPDRRSTNGGRGGRGNGRGRHDNGG